jgi:hypothetical protein
MARPFAERLSALADDQTRVRLAGRAHGYDYT